MNFELNEVISTEVTDEMLEMFSNNAQAACAIYTEPTRIL